MLSYVDLVEKTLVNNYKLPDNEFFKNESNYGVLECGKSWGFRHISQYLINTIKGNN